MAKQRIAHIPGMSASGTPHGVLVEVTDTAAVMVTITGHDGKKRHASVKLAVAGDVESLISALQAAKAAL